MKPEEKPAFSKLLTGLAELYGKGASACLFEIYWYALEKYSMDEIKRAISLHIINPDIGQFMPKPADFVRYLEGKTQERALFAWQKLINAVKHYGSYHSIVFDDQLIHYVVEELGGWILFCRSEESKLPFLFQEFSRRYIAALNRPGQIYPKQLTGITEHLNSLYDHHIEDPVFCDGTHKLIGIKTVKIAKTVKTLKEKVHEKTEKAEKIEQSEQIGKIENIAENEENKENKKALRTK